MKKSWLKNKNGEASLIAIVLIVGFVIGLGALVWILLRGVVISNIEKIRCDEQEVLLDVSAECVTEGDDLAVWFCGS